MTHTATQTPRYNRNRITLLLIGLCAFWMAACGSPAPSALVVLSNTASEPQTTAQQPIAQPNCHQPPSLADQQRVLDASLQIVLQSVDAAGNVDIARGVGTLVNLNGQRVLVTHNHWGHLLQQGATVTFWSAYGQLVHTMNSADFNTHTLYSDAGTLVLQPMVGLAAIQQTINAGSLTAVISGQDVWAVRQIAPNVRGLRLQSLTVDHHRTVEGLSAIQMRSQTAQPIIKGDSGGGLFINGSLVGNMWLTLTLTDGTPTDQSVGALLTIDASRLTPSPNAGQDAAPSAAPSTMQ